VTKEAIKKVRGEFSGLVCSNCNKTLDSDLNAALNIACLGYLTKCLNLSSDGKTFIPVLIDSTNEPEKYETTDMDVNSQDQSNKASTKNKILVRANELLHQLIQSDLNAKIYGEINSIKLPCNVSFEEVIPSTPDKFK
ncbi:MAG: transposase, partial [Deltaproteobacteria bacterium]|nr:transposase [Deltaproteobacteria bacterium]